MFISLTCSILTSSFFFFFNDTATTEIYTLSLHDALPISTRSCHVPPTQPYGPKMMKWLGSPGIDRSEEHTSELQSLTNLVCRLLLEKKKKKKKNHKGNKKDDKRKPKTNV